MESVGIVGRGPRATEHPEGWARRQRESNLADSFCIFLRLRPSSAYDKPYLPIYLANIDLSNKN